MTNPMIYKLKEDIYKAYIDFNEADTVGKVLHTARQLARQIHHLEEKVKHLKL